MWAEKLKTSDLDWGTPQVSEDFNSLSSASQVGKTSGATTITNLTAFGPFTHFYAGKNTNCKIEIANAASPMTSKFFKLYGQTNITTTSFSGAFASMGAYSFVIDKNSIGYIGLYKDQSSETSSYTKASASVYLNFTGSKIQISKNTSSGNWQDIVTSLPSTNLIEITVVYNNTASSTTYGNNQTLASKTAHVFVNGERIEANNAAKAFTISGIDLGAFRISANAANNVSIDDLKIYNSLPTIARTTKTLSSIAVKTAPTKVTYTEGEFFDPEGLEITKTFDDASTEDVSYATSASAFTFNPSLTTALQTTDISVQITVGGQSTTQSITVNSVPSHDAKFFVNGQQYGETQSVAEGSAITFPASNPSDIDDKKFMGWAEATISGTTNTAPTFVSSATMGTDDKNFYAVFATIEGSEAAETLSQTLQYDTWTYSGSTTDKSTYRLFHSGSYVESASFDRSKLSKVIVYGGTFGGDSYKKLTIGDGTNTWKSVTVSGSSQTGKNTYTDGSALSGTGVIRITSNSGSASSNGVRISKVEIYTMEGGYTYSDYCTSVTVKTLSSISVKTAPTKVTYTEEEMFDPAGLVITATYDDASTEDIAYADNASAFTFSPSLTTALTPGNQNVTITYKEKTTTQAITVNAIPTYTLTITQPAQGALTVKNGDVTLVSGASVRVGTNLTCEVTGIPAGKRFSRFYAKWGEGDGESKYKQTNPATFDNIATENISACEIYVTYKDIQYFTINYIINGVNTNPQENLEEKSTLTFPTAPETIEGKYFIGWTETAIDGTVDEEPTLVNPSELTATANKTYYAVYAAQVEGAARTYTKATTLAVGDKVVFGLGESNGKPEQAVTGANSGATISATESEWIVYTATTYEGKDGIVLQKEDGDYQRSAGSSFDFTSDNPSTFTTNASSHIIGYGRFTLYNTPSNGNKFYSSKGDDYVEFLMWKVDGGVGYSDYCTTIKVAPTLEFAPAEYTITMAETETFAPTLNNPAELELTYSATNVTPAGCISITDGVLTISAVGSATITATFAGNAQYTEATASYHLVVVGPTTAAVRTGLAEGAYGTICFPYAVAEGDFEGAVFFSITGKIENEGVFAGIEMSEVTSLAAGTPYIYRATAAAINFTYLPANAATAGQKANGLIGSLVAGDNTLTNNGTSYILSSSDNQLHKWIGGSVTTGIVGKAYIDVNQIENLPTPPEAPTRVIVRVVGMEDQATDLETIENEKVEKFFENGQIYILKAGHMYDVTGRLVK